MQQEHVHLRRSITCYFASLLVLFVLSAIHLFNWFYSFSLNKLSLICFRNWKKKKINKKIKLVWKIRVNPTRLVTWLTHLKMTCFDPRPVWPTNPIDPTWTRPKPDLISTRSPLFATSTYNQGKEKECKNTTSWLLRKEGNKRFFDMFGREFREEKRENLCDETSFNPF